MDDHPRCSDPIVIPITITIPDPRPRPPADRWGQLGRSIHPSFSDPGWFRRQLAQQRAIKASYALLASAPKPSPTASAAPLQQPVPMPSLMPLPVPGYTSESAAAIAEAVRRAQRRAAYVRGEIEQGDYGSAAGHLLLGAPFPDMTDDPLVTNLHNEPPAPEASDPPVREPELDAKTEAARAKIRETLADGLNDEHRQAAAQDRLGNPVTRPDGKVYDHEEDVAENRSGLRRTLLDLRNKINHEDQYGKPKPEASIKDGLDTLAEEEEVLRKLVKELPGLRTKRRPNNNE